MIFIQHGSYLECHIDRDSDFYYCTNYAGEGLFKVDSFLNTRKQILGTCQFSLEGIKNKKSKLRREILKLEVL